MSDALPAYLFENAIENLAAVSLLPSSDGLPLHGGAWVLVQQFNLSVDLPTPMGLDPEPILRGVTANGYFVWDRRRLIPFGTSQ